MKLSAVSLCAGTLALISSSFLPAAAPKTLKPRVATLSHTYVVGANPAQFAPVGLPSAGLVMVFLNGLYETAGVDYNVSASNTVAFVNPLTAGDRVTVVGLALAPQ